jgi:hypothetical protein
MHWSLRVRFLALIIVAPFVSKSQNVELWKPYSISKHIDTTNLNAKKLFHDSKKASSLQYNLAEFYLYKNGVQVKPAGNAKTEFFPAACICLKFNDTLMLNSGLGLQAGVGVGIKIYDGRFDGSLHANAKNALIYKANKDDSSYVNDITVEAQSQSLKLLRHPQFRSKEIIVGQYKATYRPFYAKRHQGKDEALRYSVLLIFKCKVTDMDGLREQLQTQDK